MVELLKPEECDALYATIQPWVAESMKHSAGERSTEQVMTHLLKGTAQCWLNFDENQKLNFVATTEILEYPNSKVLHIITCTGDWTKEVKEAHRHFEQFAKVQGCSAVTFHGRRGWDKALKDFDSGTGRKYKHSYVVMSMGIEQEDV